MNNAVIVSVGLAVVAVASLGCTKPAGATAEDAAGSTVASTPPAPPPPPPETSFDKINKLSTLEGALAFTTPKMSDTFNKTDEGTALLALWSIKGLHWSDVGVAKNETSFAAVMKDPDEARGKRMCASGAIIQIELEKTEAGKVFDGLLRDYSSNLYNFSAVGSVARASSWRGARRASAGSSPASTTTRTAAAARGTPSSWLGCSICRRTRRWRCRSLAESDVVIRLPARPRSDAPCSAARFAREPRTPTFVPALPLERRSV